MIGLPLKQAFTELIPMSDEMGNRCVDTYRRIFSVNNAAYVIPTFPMSLKRFNNFLSRDIR